MSVILGFNFGHDGAVALIRDNKLVSAISNERLSRVKKAVGVTADMINYVLDAGQVTLDQVNGVAFSSYIYHPTNFVKIIGRDGTEYRNHLIDLFGGESFQQVGIKIGDRNMIGYHINHHIAHCASAFYTSPFKKSACLSVDASQRHPEACSLYAYGADNKLYYLKCPGIMIGNAYSIFTEKLGLGPGLTKAGTTMGLAPYGEVIQKARDKWRVYGASFYERECQPSDSVFINLMWSELSGLPPDQSISKELSDSKASMDLAASLQYVFEQSLLFYSQDLYEISANYHADNLCLSGGSFLNSETNMKIKRESKFKDIHLFPACGDDGTAVGAALFLNHHILGNPRFEYEPHHLMYLGKEYESPQIGVEYDEEVVANALSIGKLVAWYDGRSEFGPRALGHRSILADPRSKEMRDYINSTVKKREWFRPFAPIVLSEDASEWFDIDFESKYMLFIAAVKKSELLQAVSHVDNSARLQTLSKEDNPKLYSLLQCYKQITGVPVLLNTSMNVNGEPLVETPNDAIRFFNNAKCNLLVLGDRMVMGANFNSIQNLNTTSDIDVV